MTELSVLDLVPVVSGDSPQNAILQSLDLAETADRTGYRRIWVAENHLNPSSAGSSTPVLTSMMAARTSNIRIGSGAVQLSLTSPLLVAEQFGTVAAGHPGRIDVGLGRSDLYGLVQLLSRYPSGLVTPPCSEYTEDRVIGGVTVPAAAQVTWDLRHHAYLAAVLGIRESDPRPDYGLQVDELLSYFDGTARDEAGVLVHAYPAEHADVEIWVLGSSPRNSAVVAGARGLPFGANYHTVPSAILDTVAAYRDAFRPGRIERPYLSVSAEVIVAETERRAVELAEPYARWVLDSRSGRGRPFPRRDDDHAVDPASRDHSAVTDRLAALIVGDPATSAEKLRSLATLTGADEIAVSTVTSEHRDRIRSYELLAEAWHDRRRRPAGAEPAAVAVTPG